MTDIELAIKNLEGHSICLCRNNSIITDDSKGISPLMAFIREGKMLSGYSCADLIIGKAAAMLMIKLGIKEVYGKVISRPAIELLEKHNIPYTFDTLAERIINRQGTDICPMEKTVLDIDDIEKGYYSLQQALEKIKK